MSQKYRVRINGLTPLLCHHNNLEARDALAARGRSKGKAGDDRTPPDTWSTYLYVVNEQVVIPVENVMAALLAAGKKIQIKGKQTLKAASQSVFFDESEFPLHVAGDAVIDYDAVLAITRLDTFAAQKAAVTKLGMELSVKPATVNGSSHVRVRPRFNQWWVEGTFEANDPELTPDRVHHLWEVCGHKIGLGDWRPGSKTPGPYGRFLAELETL